MYLNTLKTLNGCKDGHAWIYGGKKGVSDSFVSSVSHALQCLQISERERSTTLGEKSTALAFHYLCLQAFNAKLKTNHNYNYHLSLTGIFTLKDGITSPRTESTHGTLPQQANNYPGRLSKLQRKVVVPLSACLDSLYLCSLLLSPLWLAGGQAWLCSWLPWDFLVFSCTSSWE